MKRREGYKGYIIVARSHGFRFCRVTRGLHNAENPPSCLIPRVSRPSVWNHGRIGFLNGRITA
jgi:hypothetical protein